MSLLMIKPENYMKYIKNFIDEYLFFLRESKQVLLELWGELTIIGRLTILPIWLITYILICLPLVFGLMFIEDVIYPLLLSKIRWSFDLFNFKIRNIFFK